jgi:hypothetical protein
MLQSTEHALVGRKTASDEIPNRLFPVFRDRDELSGAADLGEAWS